MDNSKVINGQNCYFEEVRFSIEDFHDRNDQEAFAEGATTPYIQEVKDSATEPSQDSYSASTYRVRVMESERPIFMQLKYMIRDVKLVASSLREEKKVQMLKRIMTDDITSILQRATELARTSGGGRTVDMMLKLSSFGNPELTKAGKQLGLVLRQTDRIRTHMGYIPKYNQEKLNASLSQVITILVSLAFDATDVKKYQGFINTDAKEGE